MSEANMRSGIGARAAVPRYADDSNPSSDSFCSRIRFVLSAGVPCGGQRLLVEKEIEMKYRSYLVATAILVVGASLVYSAPRSTRVSKDTRIRVAPQEDVGEILEGFLLHVTEEVTEDGTMMMAGVRGVVTDTDGSMHVEIAYGGDFDRDMVLMIPRPMSFDSNGEFLGIRGPDKIKLFENHVVYVFDPVDTEEKPVVTGAKLDIFTPGSSKLRTCIMAKKVGDPIVTCKLVVDRECTSDETCGFKVDDEEDIICDCKDQE